MVNSPRLSMPSSTTPTSYLQSHPPAMARGQMAEARHQGSPFALFPAMGICEIRDILMQHIHRARAVALGEECDPRADRKHHG